MWLKKLNFTTRRNTRELCSKLSLAAYSMSAIKWSTISPLSGVIFSINSFSVLNVLESSAPDMLLFFQDKPLHLWYRKVISFTFVTCWGEENLHHSHFINQALGLGMWIFYIYRLLYLFHVSIRNIFHYCLIDHKKQMSASPIFEIRSLSCFNLE